MFAAWVAKGLSERSGPASRCFVPRRSSAAAPGAGSVAPVSGRSWPISFRATSWCSRDAGDRGSGCRTARCGSARRGLAANSGRAARAFAAGDRRSWHRAPAARAGLPRAAPPATLPSRSTKRRSPTFSELGRLIPKREARSAEAQSARAEAASPTDGEPDEQARSGGARSADRGSESVESGDRTGSARAPAKPQPAEPRSAEARGGRPSSARAAGRRRSRDSPREANGIAVNHRGRTDDARRIATLLAPVDEWARDRRARRRRNATSSPRSRPPVPGDAVVATALRVLPWLSDPRLPEPVSQATLAASEATIVLTPFGSPGGDALLVAAVALLRVAGAGSSDSRGAPPASRRPPLGQRNAGSRGLRSGARASRDASCRRRCELAGSLTAFGPVAPAVLRDAADLFRVCLFGPGAARACAASSSWLETCSARSRERRSGHGDFRGRAARDVSPRREGRSDRQPVRRRSSSLSVSTARPGLARIEAGPRREGDRAGLTCVSCAVAGRTIERSCEQRLWMALVSLIGLACVGVLVVVETPGARPTVARCRSGRRADRAQARRAHHATLAERPPGRLRERLVVDLLRGLPDDYWLVNDVTLGLARGSIDHVLDWARAGWWSIETKRVARAHPMPGRRMVDQRGSANERQPAAVNSGACAVRLLPGRGGTPSWCSRPSGGSSPSSSSRTRSLASRRTTGQTIVVRYSQLFQAVLQSSRSKQRTGAGDRRTAGPHAGPPRRRATAPPRRGAGSSQPRLDPRDGFFGLLRASRTR